MRLVLSISLLTGLLVLSAWSMDWESHTYSNDVFDIEASGNTILCATCGGVLRFDPADRSFTKYTNVDGLLECPSNAVTVDYQGNWWIAHATKGVTVRSVEGDVRHFTRYEGIPGDTICCIRAMGDVVMVGTDDGVWSVDTHGDPFGSQLTQNLYLENHLVTAISPGDTVVWYGSSGGLYGAYRSAYTDTVYHYTSDDGLPSNSILSAIDYGELWVGTDSGPAVYEDTAWVEISSGLYSEEIRDLIFNRDTLWAATAGGVAFLRDSLWTMRNTGLSSSSVTSLTADGSSILWCGTVRGGIAGLDGSWRAYTSLGLLNNELEGVAVSSTGGPATE
jgi:ligand-binding sensor domain-containing protein